MPKTLNPIDKQLSKLISKYQNIYVQSEESLDNLGAFEDTESTDEGYYYTGVERGENNISEKILKDLQTLSNLLKENYNG